MSTTFQVIIAVSVAIIAFYFLLLTTLTIIAFLKLRAFQAYMQKLLKDKIDISLEHLKNITVSLEGLTSSTAGKINELTDVIPELRDKLKEIIDLLDLVQEKLRNPLLNFVSAIKVFSEKMNRWF
ncbi:MAG: hypothetical protein A3F83_12015 [Candidatus Glassbacteria bacterium RIFCSPLOWO2_12_FULL_58_11]|uniref:DUF948 domain-containing protein n=2 Tax=Candidatus Glassiibacteriota TaxID=1817805 RepID=A0A1F5YLR5_9BACT|nr:MAG: hypothetical protein A2Z86_03075 [Candidatus Glassbacteria bacterium GWA2_58_10]OGG01148.1 MAG: hypothetical protein A3F83_12015 [Candidatus Glassbacteria bacterium RIFCSPLOWO2_12_FULL_58_11]